MCYVIHIIFSGYSKFKVWELDSSCLYMNPVIFFFKIAAIENRADLESTFIEMANASTTPFVNNSVIAINQKFYTADLHEMTWHDTHFWISAVRNSLDPDYTGYCIFTTYTYMVGTNLYLL